MKYGILCVVLSGTIVHSYSNHASTLGRTHFIVGMPQAEYAQYKKISSMPVSSLDVEHKILFAPDDDIHAELLQLIQNEPKSIKVAMYLFTDKDIAQALCEAKQRGVQIECITDATCISNKFNKVDALAEHNIPVWVYRAANDKRGLNNAMHHKFIVCEGSCKVVTGSLNITHSAQNNNQENIVIMSDVNSLQRFDAQFEKLKTRCSRMTPHNKNMHLR